MYSTAINYVALSFVVEGENVEYCSARLSKEGERVRSEQDETHNIIVIYNIRAITHCTSVSAWLPKVNSLMALDSK